MQAQFYPPERPSNSSNASTRQTVRPESSLPLSRQTEGAQERWQRGRQIVVTDELRASAQGGSFQAIATILNTALSPHHMSAWVGEAGPGYLQITLTVKRPPQRQPLIRFVSHQLYSLRSDVILGAHLTVQVAQTNLILWNQLVRLPLPDIYKQPSKLEIAREQLKEWQQQAGDKALTTWAMGQKQVKEWLEQRRSRGPNPIDGTQPPSAQKLTVPESEGTGSEASGPQTVQGSKNADNADNRAASTHPLPPKAIGAIPPEILQQAQLHAKRIEHAQEIPQPQSAPYQSAPYQSAPYQSVTHQSAPYQSAPYQSVTHQSVTHQSVPYQSVPYQSVQRHASLIGQSTQATHQLPTPDQGNIQGLAHPQADEPSLEQQQWSAMAMVPGVVMVPATANSAPNTDLATELTTDAETAGSFNQSVLGGGGGWGSGLGRFRAKIVDQVINPSPWMLGGAAIAAFLVGSALMDSVAPNVASQDNTPSVSQPSEPVVPTHDSLDGASTSLQNDTSTPPDHGGDSVGSPSLRTRPTHRAKTVEMGDQTIDVVPLIPTTSDLSKVTLTFSGKAIVPFPPPEPEKPKGWRSLFYRPSTPISHPADIAMALINDPISTSASTSSSILSTQALRRGGIDLVNIAGNDIVKSQAPSLKETMNRLEQSAIRSVGAGLTEAEASRPQIFDIKGHRIAVLGYTDAHLYAANQEMAGNNPGSRQRLAADIDAIREQVDWVIVSYHWSNIDTTGSTPTDQQVRLAHLAVDEGADLVVGYHPHMMQGGEVYNGRAIAYSLGQVPAPTVSEEAGVEAEVKAKTEIEDSVESANALDSVPHQLPESGIRISPADPNGSLARGDSEQSRNNTMATMLKVVLSDRHMGVEFIPIHTQSGTSEFVQGNERQAVLRTLKEASRSFDEPLALKGMAYLSLEQNIRAFSNSAGESFQPEQTEGFIDRAE